MTVPGVTDWVVVGQAVRGVEHRDTSKKYHAEPRCMGDGVGAANRVELVEQRAYVELGGVDGDAEPESDGLVRGALRKQRQNLQFARRQRAVAVSRWRCDREKHQGRISALACTDQPQTGHAC